MFLKDYKEFLDKNPKKKYKSEIGSVARMVEIYINMNRFDCGDVITYSKNKELKKSKLF